MSTKVSTARTLMSGLVAGMAFAAVVAAPAPAFADDEVAEGTSGGSVYRATWTDAGNRLCARTFGSDPARAAIQPVGGGDTLRIVDQPGDGGRCFSPDVVEDREYRLRVIRTRTVGPDVVVDTKRFFA